LVNSSKDEGRPQKLPVTKSASGLIENMATAISGKSQINSVMGSSA